MSVLQTFYALPDDHCRLIGQFITRWAYLEWRLRETMYIALDISPKIGRLVVREPRVGDYLTMLEDTLDQLGMTAPVDWKKLRQIMPEIESWRDKFAHAIWLVDPNSETPAIQDTRGKTLDPKTNKHVKSKITPKGIRVSSEELENAVAGVDKAVSVIDEINLAISAQRATTPSKSP